MNEILDAYNRKRVEDLKKENEELKRELRKRTSIDVEYKVKKEE